MFKIAKKIALVLALILVCASLTNCEKQLDVDLLDKDYESHRLLIIPDNPDSNDEILVIETICGNESDVILTFQGTQIKYQRNFNSLMMMPCSPHPDTTIIGKLNPGTYELIHCMIDKNHNLTDSIFLLDTIFLLVE